ncbi:MAG TPA: VWA domain-containing protein [Actinomycetota bacterium]|nr:VWA domain-containing protein [Actinomycetota bacterium]
MGTIVTAILAVLIIVGVAAVVLTVFGKEQARDSRGRVKSKPTSQQRAVTAARRRGGLPGWVRFVPFVLLAGAVVSLVLAVMQFTVDREEREATVMLAMDASNSMQQTDVAPSRLVAAEDAARAFVEELPEGYRVGVVTFAGSATERVAPVADRTSVADAFTGLATDRGTAIGDGLMLALDAIERDRAASGDRSAAVLLLSDGVDSGSATPPTVAAERARTLQVPVFTVVLGSAETGADPAVLDAIAEATGAESFTALSAAELTSVYETLGSELSTRLAIGGTGPLFVALGAFFAVAAGLVVLVTSRRD